MFITGHFLYHRAEAFFRFGFCKRLVDAVIAILAPGKITRVHPVRSFICFHHKKHTYPKSLSPSTKVITKSTELRTGFMSSVYQKQGRSADAERLKDSPPSRMLMRRIFYARAECSSRS